MNLEDAVADALRAVAEDPAGELTLGRREIVWAALGPLDDGPAGRPTEPHRRRAAIAFATCDHVLGLWEAERPADDQPRQVMAIARLALDGDISEDEAKSAAGALWGRVENLTQLVGDPDRLAVGFACCKAIDVALYDESFAPALEDVERSSFGLDAFEVDTAFFAAVAAAGGPPWSQSSDPECRREFWTWWLREALMPPPLC